MHINELCVQLVEYRSSVHGPFVFTGWISVIFSWAVCVLDLLNIGHLQKGHLCVWFLNIDILHNDLLCARIAAYNQLYKDYLCV